MSHLPSCGDGCGLSLLLTDASPTPTHHDGLDHINYHASSEWIAMIHQWLAQNIMRHPTFSIQAEVRHPLWGVWAGLSGEQVLINWRNRRMLSSTNQLAKVEPIIHSQNLQLSEPGWGPTIHLVSALAPRQQIADSTATRFQTG